MKNERDDGEEIVPRGDHEVDVVHQNVVAVFLELQKTYLLDSIVVGYSNHMVRPMV